MNRSLVVMFVILLGACASARPKEAAPGKAGRALDTAPERRAALPGADRESQPENTEARFNRESAKEHRETHQEPAAGEKMRTGVVEEPKAKQPEKP